MEVKNKTKFHIQSLNQEKLFNELSKSVLIFEIDRINKNEAFFECNYSDRKFIKNLLKKKNVKIISMKNSGVLTQLKNMFASVGLICAYVVFLIFYFLQSQFIWQYEVNGLEKLNKTEIVDFVKENFSNKKPYMDTKEIELTLIENFNEISLVSCMIKGQTLVLNVKEKLLPDEMVGEFSPIVAQKNGKITKIDLVSGTLNVGIGDFVKMGDILVFPYVFDNSGNKKSVEAEAEIWADVYNEGTCDHYEKIIKVERTGKKIEQNIITLFGLPIYQFKENLNFDLFETEVKKINLSNNLFLPFKMTKTVFYELKQTVVESKFEDVADEYISKAKEKALENCQNCDKIIDEFYTLRHISGITIVNYCIITQEKIGG